MTLQPAKPPSQGKRPPFFDEGLQRHTKEEHVAWGTLSSGNVMQKGSCILVFWIHHAKFCFFIWIIQMSHDVKFSVSYPKFGWLPEYPPSYLLVLLSDFLYNFCGTADSKEGRWAIFIRTLHLRSYNKTVRLCQIIIRKSTLLPWTLQSARHLSQKDERREMLKQWKFLCRK